MGSGHEKTGFSTQSDALPGAWLVLDPSKPQMGRSVVGWLRILVLDRSNGVGSVPSIQMYSALIVTHLLPCWLRLGKGWAVRHHARSEVWQGCVTSLFRTV